jgi:hypothetical protein
MAISINVALALIDSSAETGVVSLSFIKADGSIRTIKRATKSDKRGFSEANKTSNFKYRIQGKRVVVVRDLDKPDEEWRTIKIDTIIKFNGQTVVHNS